MDSPELSSSPRARVSHRADRAPHRVEMVRGLRSALPLGVALVILGASFGIVAHAAGMGVASPIVMSATTFAGSAQFAAAAVLGSGGGAAAAITTAVLFNVRYVSMGISVAPAMTGGPVRRFLTAQSLTDESWAIGHTGDGQYSRGRLLGAGLLVYATWVGGTALGVLDAHFLADPRSLGLDVVSPVIFLVLLGPQLRERRMAATALAAAAVALALVPVTSTGIALVAASAVSLWGLIER
ncbi:MAG: AzlC family ABC transporter permease [Frankia sp.]